MADELKMKLQKINDDLLKVEVLKKIQDATNVPIGAILLGVLTICVVLVGFDTGCANAIVQVLAVGYPAIQSVLALESEDKDDDKQWLTYWMVYSIFVLFEGIGNWLLKLIPFYFLIKLLFLIWLQNPLTRGATILYNQYIQPLGKKYKAQIDVAHESLKQLLGGPAAKAKDQ